MSLSFGRDHLSIPGPSVMPERVLRAMHRPAPDIYGDDLINLADTVYKDLNALAFSRGEVVIYIGNGHAAWEASLTNTLSRGDKILGLVTGRFGQGWIDMAQALGVEAQIIDFGHELPADPSLVEEALKTDTKRQIKAVLTVQTDTSTSVTNDIQAIRSAIDAANHPALLMADCMASFACEPFHMDKLGVDVMVAGCQKGLMTPPGLAFTFLGEKVWEAYNAANLKTPYWDWQSRVNPSIFAMRFCGTPPTHHLYGLREALDMLLEEGIENVWHRHQILASCVWAAIDVWSESNQLRCNVPEMTHRSLAVTTIQTANGLAIPIRQWCQEAGVSLGVGLNLKPQETTTDSVFRIGHMGHLNPAMLTGTLATIDAALKALGIAHGDGALDAVARIVAQHANNINAK